MRCKDKNLEHGERSIFQDSSHSSERASILPFVFPWIPQSEATIIFTHAVCFLGFLLVELPVQKRTPSLPPVYIPTVSTGTLVGRRRQVRTGRYKEEDGRASRRRFHHKSCFVVLLAQASGMCCVFLGSFHHINMSAPSGLGTRRRPHGRKREGNHEGEVGQALGPQEQRCSARATRRSQVGRLGCTTR